MTRSKRPFEVRDHEVDDNEEQSPPILRNPEQEKNVRYENLGEITITISFSTPTGS
jgi:hypothetical protein